MKDLKAYSLSIKGKRKENEDSLIIFEPSDNSLFIAVADGMGGTAGGSIASYTVIQSCIKTLKQRFRSEVSSGDLKELLITIFYNAQLSVKQKTLQHPELQGMGTTLACVLILEDKYVWGNLGDSRIYCLDKKEFKQITKDHTSIEEYRQLNSGSLPQEMISYHGNLLTRSIDGGKDVPDIFPESENCKILKSGDLFLVCSDGLILNKVEDDSSGFIQSIINSNSLEQAAEILIDNAYINGSTDNITVILLEKGDINRDRFKKIYRKNSVSRI